MSKRTLLAAAGILTAIAAGPAFADSIDRTQHNQQKRISQGVRSGELTRREAQRLEAHQGRINSMERRAKSDGFIDPWERRQIGKAQAHASRDIYREKHDGESRWRRWWWHYWR